MKQFIIIGNSAAGVAAAEAIKKRDLSSKITILSDEDHPSYCRCLISYFLAGDVSEDKLLYQPGSFYKSNNIELFLNKKVSRIDPKKNRVICEDKTNIEYDSLLIATGASARFPHIPGIKRRGVFAFRTIKDAKDIQQLLSVTKSAGVLGGGLVGLKAAYALKKNGIRVKVIVHSNQVLSQMLDFEAAQLIQRRLEENGVDVVLEEGAVEVIGEGDIRALKLSSGKAFDCSLVIAGKGVAPNIDLVKDTEIKVNQGIAANVSLQTNIPNIYAAGDAAETLDLIADRVLPHTLWPIAVEQGRIAGANMAGENIEYQGSLSMNSVEFFGLPAVSLGKFKTVNSEDGFEELKKSDGIANTYKKLILKDNRLRGAVMVGNIANSGIYLRLIKEKLDISSVRERLMQDDFSYPDVSDLLEGKESIYV